MHSAELFTDLVPDAIPVRLVIIGLSVLIRDVIKCQHTISAFDSFLVALEPVKL